MMNLRYVMLPIFIWLQRYSVNTRKMKPRNDEEDIQLKKKKRQIKNAHMTNNN